MTVAADSSQTATYRALPWLPPCPPDWRQQLALKSWPSILTVIQTDLDFLACAKIDRALIELQSAAGPLPSSVVEMRLAVLSSSTTHHLIAAMRVAALRFGILLRVHECLYGQYMQELAAPDSPLATFSPQLILLALDAHHLNDLAQAGIDPITHLREAWSLARNRFHATVLQQTGLPVFPTLLGSNEQLLATSPAQRITHFNQSLRSMNSEPSVHLLSVDQVAAQQGLANWHDRPMWLRAKQEVHPAAAPRYAAALAPLLAAVAGRSRKCLVLDLDNTLWGGVIGDDGLEGIQLGQGNAAGEAFLDFQRYCLHLRERGILLAVCSKNDASTALDAIQHHPAMLLRREHFAAFVTNWQDKATNLRSIAHSLQIGTDALVFADDNPFERELVRREMPEVAVPELPEDAAEYASTLAQAGYFESVQLTPEDLARARDYQSNAQREQLRASATDLEGYLRSLRMTLRHRAFDEANLPRLVQLIGKTNQFNLTTQRYGIEEVRTLMRRPDVVTLQLALSDAFGENGTIALVLAEIKQQTMYIDTWLMSCRVLGRRVEEATLHLLFTEAKQRGVTQLVGQWRLTSKNAMVRGLYPRLGFVPIPGPAPIEEGCEWFALDLANYQQPDLPMDLLAE